MGLGDNDYNEGSYTCKVIIKKKPITVKADNKEKIEGQFNPELTYTVTGGLVGSDKLTGSLKCDGQGVGTHDIVQDTLTNANNPNYDISFEKGVMTVQSQALNTAIGCIKKVPVADEFKNREDVDKNKEGLMDANEDYEKLTDKEKEQLPKEVKDKWQAIKDKVGTINHTCPKTGTTVEGAPWHVRVEPTQIPAGNAQNTAFSKKLDNNKKCHYLHDMQLIDTHTDQKWTPEAGKDVTVTVPVASLPAGTTKVQVAKEKADGTIEYTDATVKDGRVSYKATTLGLQGVVTTTTTTTKTTETPTTTQNTKRTSSTGSTARTSTPYTSSTSTRAPRTGDASMIPSILLAGAALVGFGGLTMTERKRK
jgi:hypothetical protein